MRRSTLNGLWINLIMAALLLIMTLISLTTGKMGLSIGEILDVFLGMGTGRNEAIIYHFRMPRIVLAILVGIGMGLSGAVMQTLLRNDMASPGTLGISAGSGLFVMLVITGFQITSLASHFLLPALAFIGGITAALIIFLLAYRHRTDLSPTSLIMTGVAAGTGYNALSLMITLKMDEYQMEFALRWSEGSLWGDKWDFIGIMLPPIVLISLYIYKQYRSLNVFALGAPMAKSLGMRVRFKFITLAIAAVTLSSVSVAFGGSFFFVGLIAPHIARRICGSNHGIFLPVSALAGALLVLTADTLVRSTFPTFGVPTGVIITLISAPYFLYLLTRAR
ncbi:FecCD family ABC transporter permease [Cohnella abietis]|uniref:Iron compound ABC transporter permease n=1 Tax=Cohnella abietis TaxID=2507935 RepID=A0A3T1CYH7_9BACL|nr:iron ABC transporter permease [Cohnella abietis]BBI30917.1 iron compound ABC transporter permease [Cohnella abietis]